MICFPAIFDVESRKFCIETATCSSVIPTLKRIRDYLEETTFNPCVSDFVESLVESNNKRIQSLKNNKTLHVATLLDPRFAYSGVWSTECWKLCEEDLLFAAKKCKF